jgi:DNA-binding protein HU-beta
VVFGTFKLVALAVRSGFNPRAGEKIRIPAAKVPKFVPGTAFKEAVDPAGAKRKAAKKAAALAKAAKKSAAVKKAVKAEKPTGRKAA